MAYRDLSVATVAVLILAGCASAPQQLTRDQWLQVRNRHYENMTPQQVLSASEKIFNLADGSDVSFSHNNDSLRAIRWAAPFPVHIWYHWNIKAVPNGSNTDVNVAITTTAHGWAVPSAETPHDFPEVIGLFYDRLDYFVGRNSAWTTCNDAKTRNPAANFEALCLLAEDMTPATK